MFKNVGHFFASIFKGALTLIGAVEKDATTPIPGFGTLTPLQIGESIAAAISPASVDVINAGMALLGEVAGAVKAAQSAGQQVVASKGLNLTLDENLLQIVLPVVNRVIGYIEQPDGAKAAIVKVSAPAKA